MNSKSGFRPVSSMLEKGKHFFGNAKSKAKEALEKHVKPYMPQATEPLWKRALAWGLFWGALGFLIVLTLFTLLVAMLSINLPDVRNFGKLAGVESTIIMDRDGGILYTIHGEENRKYVPLNEISQHIQKATIAIEDDQFYHHIGFDLPAIARGALYEIFSLGKPRGASTITQQLSKNAFLTPERSYVRKIRELILSIRIERAYEKNKILELYLNRIPYGNNAYGIELASQIYFEKSAKELNLAESAILASLPRKPTYYSPYGEHAFSILEKEFTKEEIEKRDIQSVRDLKESEYSLGLIGKEIHLGEKRVLNVPGRADIVLHRMAELGYISEEDRDGTIQETRRIIFKPYRTNIRAPHLVFYVRSLLEEKYGKDAVESGGLRVYTTIDAKYQDLAEKLVAEQVPLNEKSADAKNAALLAVDAKTGEIISLVGSADYFKEEIDGNVNMTLAYRQPGSSFKPFVYAKAFLNGYGPATVLYDTRTHFGGGYTPDNFDGTFRGPMPIRLALGQSRNIPAIKTYFLAGQEDSIIELTEKMGIKGLRERKPIGGYGPSLAIGSGEIRLIDMVQAFSVFANSGKKKDLVAIRKVEDRNGKVLEQWDPEKDVREAEVLDPQVAYLINNILSDQSVNLGHRLNIHGHTVAVKTGTSNKVLPDKREFANNLWVFGYTPQVVVGVWSGNSDGSALGRNAEAYVNSTPIWGGFLKEYLKDKPDEPFPIPSQMKKTTASKASGKFPSPLTPDNFKITEIFTSFGVPTEFDDVFVEKEINTIDHLLPNGNTPPKYRETKLFMNHHDPIATYPTWLAGIQEWVKQKQTEDSNFLGLPPAETTQHFTPAELANEPTVQILEPLAGTIVGNGPLEVKVDFDIPHGYGKLQLLLDNKVRFTKDLPTKEGKIIITNVAKEGPHTVKARVYDRIGYFGEATVEIEVQREEKENTNG